ncbi:MULTISPECIES: flagellar hook-basal body complex protein FliE [Symmachiella]|uniref:Flagellar hook-basal body complex protein FliE n=2 Tax=Symmachiella TaxID=2795780 RepID=A0A517ZGM9_9PLAN|nr:MULTISPECIES: flagellar hook-basal body complex protein FliE [Symmachiella]QDT46069.1 flagellar hook-basal body protein FliE [Symmachiella dynata]QDU41636.1 flagellar hook-basal body protein FliE [Symmachiella dynata]TWU12956.1 flagellar hook-basal body protein FliE [Symmachiella macrocystis]
MPGSIGGFQSNLFPAMPKMPHAPIGGAVGGAAGADAPQVNFQEALLNSINQVGMQEKQAYAAIESSLVSDEDTQVHAMMAMKKAELAFRTMIQIRNKMVDAYNEIKDMRF